MKFASWPDPPINPEHVYSEQTPPEIPSTYKLFGLEYKVVEGNPFLDIPSKPLDKEHMKECINKSLSLFIKTIKSFDGEFVNELRDLHAHINEEINLAKACQGKEILQECKNDKIRAKMEIIKKINETKRL